MNDVIFLKNFVFNEFSYLKPKHNDNSHGVERHFIGYMKKGSAVIASDAVRLELNEGDMFYIPKGCRYHSYWKTDSRDVLLDSIGFLYFPIIEKNGFVLQKIDYDEEIMGLFMPLSNDKTVDNASIGCLYALLSRLEKILEEDKSEKADLVIDHLLQLMNEDHTLNINEYAQKCLVSEALLYLYCKRKLKKTPNMLRREIACKKAEELLCTTTLSVEDISQRCGFSSASYFRKVLQSERGMTPSELRKNAKLL